MGIQMTFLGHSGFLVESGSHAVAIDPFLTGNPLATLKADQIKCTHIVLTPGHGDHFGDTIVIAKANKAEVIAAYEICEYVGEQGISGNPGNPGGRIDTPFGWVAFTQAFHSSSYEGRYMGMPCGIVLHMGGVTLYHCGDTTIFGDMKLIGEIYRPDVACIPIGDRFTMGPELATRAAKMICPKLSVPIHYQPMDLLVQTADDFKPQGVEVKVLQPGEHWAYDV